MNKNKTNYSNEWKQTINGKLIIFWLFSVILPILCIVGIALSAKEIKTNKTMIVVLVFAIIDLVVVVADMYAVATRKSSALLVGMGILSILAIGLIIQGIFMILIADYAELPSDIDHIDIENNIVPNNKKQTIKTKAKITNWTYYSHAETLELEFGKKKVNIFNIEKDFVKKFWKDMSPEEQTEYYFKHWNKK